MNKIIKSILFSITFFIPPVIVGLGAAELLMKIYYNSNQNLIVGATICILAGLVIIWFPLIFLIEDFWFIDRKSFKSLILFVFMVGTLAPIILGFSKLGGIITTLLIFTSIYSVEKIRRSISELKKKVDEQEY